MWKMWDHAFQHMGISKFWLHDIWARLLQDTAIVNNRIASSCYLNLIIFFIKKCCEYTYHIDIWKSISWSTLCHRMYRLIHHVCLCFANSVPKRRVSTYIQLNFTVADFDITFCWTCWIRITLTIFILQLALLRVANRRVSTDKLEAKFMS